MSPSSQHRSTVIVLVVVALVVAALAVGLTRLRAHPHVALVGDSITQLTEQPFHHRLDGDYDVAVIGIPGATIGQLSGSTDAVRDLSPRELVLNMGTNDILQQVPTASSLDALRHQLDDYRGVSCVHLVTVNEHMVSTNGTDLLTPAQKLNEGIRSLAAERGARVIDWAGIVAQADDQHTPLTFDTVHPNEEGQRRLADAYAAALAAC